MTQIVYLIMILSFNNFSIAQSPISLQPFATGFNSPVDIANAGDSRLFVVEQDGIIKIVQPNGTINPTAFLNIQMLTNESGERGLLGLAFDPNYTINGYFYINYTNNNGNTVIARYQVSSSNPNIANAASGTILLTVNQPFSNHNGGCLKFGPDGFLYIGLGDGGSGGDPEGYAQNLTVPSTHSSRVLLGKMLRLSVTNTANAPYYTIPATNPFIGQAGKEEIWALGLRNPWKFSFDSANGELWIADVGQNLFEEINKSSTQQSTALNYGWRCYEGDNPFNTAGCPPVANLEQPLASISHSNGSCSVTGGYVYRGAAIPSLVGKYLFTDFCYSNIGTVNAAGNVTYLLDVPGKSFSSFGVDIQNEVYIASINTGELFKIIGTLSNSNTELQPLLIAPNPIKDSITIQNATALDLQKVVIYDSAGRIVLEQKLGVTNTVRISGLKTGIYYLTALNYGGQESRGKIIVE